MTKFQKNQKPRDFRIDFAKAILIVLVILGHSFHVLDVENNGHLDMFVHKIIYSFHMPAFMLISGYLFYSSNTKDLATVVKIKLKSIGIPFLSFSCLMFLLGRCKDLFLSDSSIDISAPLLLGNLLDYLLTSKTMWFLASLLINSLIVACLSRYKAGFIGYILIFIISFFIPPENSYIAPAYLFMFPYFIVGYYLKKMQISLFMLQGGGVQQLLFCWFYQLLAFVYTTVTLTFITPECIF